MTKFIYAIPENDSLWGHTDILDTDLEKLEFSKNFAGEDVYNSILDEEPVYHSLMNFPEEEDELQDAGNDTDDDAFENRNSYQDADKDGIYYFI